MQNCILSWYFTSIINRYTPSFLLFYVVNDLWMILFSMFLFSLLSLKIKSHFYLRFFFFFLLLLSEGVSWKNFFSLLSSGSGFWKVNLRFFLLLQFSDTSLRLFVILEVLISYSGVMIFSSISNQQQPNLLFAFCWPE